MNFRIVKDGEGYLAEVEGNDNLYAYGETENEARGEFLGVLDMMIDYHTELMQNEKELKMSILKSKKLNYAV